ncbi:MAG: DUF72 domain-containing protein [Actinomycetota bacterium]
MTATVRVGTCAWVEKGLIADWYPPTATSAEARLRFYAEHFDTVEVDASYYAIPAERTTFNWAERTPAGFVFHVKAFGLITGHRVRPEQLPADLRPLVSEVTGQGHVVPSAALEERVLARFARALRPLADAGRLGGVLVQLPPSAVPGRAAWERLDRIRAGLPGHELMVEFRQRDWLGPDLVDETHAGLRERGLTYVAVDAPRVATPNVAQTVVAATSATGYVRFHGRNAASWNRRGGGASARFDHLYADDELAEWVEPLRALARSTSRLYAMFNTNADTQGPDNADRLRQLLAQAGVAVAPAAGPAQRGLFD